MREEKEKLDEMAMADVGDDYLWGDRVVNSIKGGREVHKTCALYFLMTEGILERVVQKSVVSVE